MRKGVCRYRFQRISPKKVKPVLDLVRGKTVQEALWTLSFVTKKKAAGFIEKAIKAATASYREKAGADARPDDEIIVSLAKVDRGPIYKRFRAAWRGRAVMIRRHFSHITIEVEERR